jgi:hypothetical protein
MVKLTVPFYSQEPQEQMNIIGCPFHQLNFEINEKTMFYPKMPNLNCGAWMIFFNVEFGQCVNEMITGKSYRLLQDP